MALKSVLALNALAGDAVLGATALEVRAASRVVVSLVRMQLAGPAACSATLARDRHQGPAVRDEVAFAASFPSPVEFMYASRGSVR